MARTWSVPRRLVAASVAGAVAAAIFALPSSQAPAQAASQTPIMQPSELSPAQIAGWFHANSPGGYKAAVPVEFLAAYFVFEGEKEGVSGDIAFAQAIDETDWFRYGGQVHPSQNNYGGIGATDGGASGASFRSPRIGVRAQIQHLRAYADPTVTESNLAYPLESPRFDLVSPKGRAPNWEDLGGIASDGKVNWASNPNYSEQVLGHYSDMEDFAAANPQLQGQWMFSDVEAGDRFEYDIVSIAIEGITKGCNPPKNNLFCADRPVTREQMASFLVRAKGLKPTSTNVFRDVSSTSTHGRDINALAAAGITKGCNPPKNDRFCPDREVTREQMASFLARAEGLSPSIRDRFRDVANTNTHRRDINAIAEEGITRGCNPPVNDRFCPDRTVTRQEMAAFLNRAFLQ